MKKKKLSAKSQTLFLILLAMLFLSTNFCAAQSSKIKTGADQNELYFLFYEEKTLPCALIKLP